MVRLRCPADVGIGDGRQRPLPPSVRSTAAMAMTEMRVLTQVGLVEQTRPQAVAAGSFGGHARPSPLPATGASLSLHSTVASTVEGIIARSAPSKEATPSDFRGFAGV
jgi:hypothetical protein